MIRRCISYFRTRTKGWALKCYRKGSMMKSGSSTTVWNCLPFKTKFKICLNYTIW